MPLFNSYITPGTKIGSYKYAAGCATPLDNILNPWWELVAKNMPTWVAPNLITLGGFGCTIIPFVMVLWFTPTLQEPFPRWGCFLVALLMFLYQTLDAVDGKHARRTGNASALGQLFDHGCDIISANLCGIVVLAVGNTGLGLVQFLTIVISGQVHQFMYMWAEHHSHVFYCATGWVGVSEAQFTIIFICLLAGARPSWLSGPMFPPLSALSSSLPDWPKHCPDVRSVMMVAVIIVNTYTAVVFILGKGLGNVPKGNLPTAVAQLTSFLAFVVAEWFFFHTGVFVLELNLGVIFIAMTTAYSIVLIRLLISSCCGMPFSPLQWPLIPFFVVTAAVVPLGRNPQYVSVASWLIVAVAVWQSLYLADLCLSSITTIKQTLAIRCFHVRPPPPKAVESSENVAEHPSTRARNVGA